MAVYCHFGNLMVVWSQSDGKLGAMYVTVDRVGRVVIPKALRVALGITPDTELELIPDGTGLRIEPVRRHQRSIDTSDGLPILGNVEGAVLTDDDIRRLRDDIQR
jgi:AbrB family looped-hinge helix DNA binding protein